MKTSIAIVLFAFCFHTSWAVWLLNNKKVKFDPYKEQAKEEVGREDELFRRAIQEMLSDPEYIARQRKEHIRQHLGPFNGANLTYLFGLLNVKTLEQAAEAVKYDNLQQLDDTTRLKVLAEIAPKQIDDDGNIIPNVAVTSENIEEVRKKSREAQRRFDEIHRHMDEDEKFHKGRGLLPDKKTIFCFYNAHSVHDRKYSLKKHFPFDLCTAVVYCCVGVRDDEKRLYFYNETVDQDPETGLIAFFKYVDHYKPDLNLHLGIGGPMVEYGEVSSAIEYHKVASFIQALYRWLKENKIRPAIHLVWYIPEPHRLASILDHQHFIRKLTKQLRDKSPRRLVLVVPSSVSDSAAYSYATQAHDVILLDTPESLDNPGVPECPLTFKNYFGNYESFKSLGISLRPALFYSITAGFVLKGFSYDSKKHPPLYMSSYADVCKVPKEELEVQEECLIARSSGAWTSTLSPDTFTSWAKLKNPLKGVAIMDPEWDDFENVCGRGPNPIIKELNTVLRPED